MVSGPLKLRIMTRAGGKPTGFDSAITSVPRHWYVTVGGKPAFLARYTLMAEDGLPPYIDLNEDAPVVTSNRRKAGGTCA